VGAGDEFFEHQSISHKILNCDPSCLRSFFFPLKPFDHICQLCTISLFSPNVEMC